MKLFLALTFASFIATVGAYAYTQKKDEDPSSGTSSDVELKVGTNNKNLTIDFESSETSDNETKKKATVGENNGDMDVKF